MKRILSAVAALAWVSTFGACAFEHSATVLSPSTLASAAGSLAPAPASTPSYVGAWTSQSVGIPTPSSCTNFQWSVTSQTATSMSGTFSAQCAGSISITGDASGELHGTTVPITASGNASLPGVPSCSFSLSGTGTIEDNGTALRIPYSGTTCLGPVSGTEVLHKKSDPAPTPPPLPPAPEPTPAPPSVGSYSNDAIDLHSATIMNSPNVADWPATATITGLSLDGNGIHVDFTKRDGPGSWPDVPFMTPGENLQYTVWIVINVNGRWYASGCLQFWRGLDRMGGPPSQYAQNWYYDPIRWGPMAGHQPQPGEQVGFLVTAGDARNNGVALVHERSNVVSIAFPSGGSNYGFSLSRLRLPVR